MTGWAARAGRAAARWRQWTPVPRRWRHWTLRSRLVVVTAALTAVALIAANAAGLLLLRSYLTDRVDQQLERMARTHALARLPDSGPGVSRLWRLPAGGGPSKAVVIYRADGTLLPGMPPADQLSPPQLGSYAELLKQAADGRPFTVDAVNGGGSSWRVKVVHTVSGGLAVVAVPLRDVDATAEGLLLIDGAVTLLVLLVLGLVAASVVRIGLRPLTRMETISAEITAGDLSRRVEDTDPHTEPGRLGIALNTMLDRIGAEMAGRSASEQRLRQFVADASHELRTPLTSIRGFAELYRRGGAPPGPLLDETMSRIEGEAARMGILVEDLLLLARLDMERPMRRSPVDLLAIAADTVRDAYARVPHRPVRLAAFGPDDGAFEAVTVLGDEPSLRQVATNLVANALQHTPPETEITVRVGQLAGSTASPAQAGRGARAVQLGIPWYPTGDPAQRQSGVVAGTSGWTGPVARQTHLGAVAVLEVADTGPGIPPEHASRIFERLYRVDSSRTRGPGVGSGLGLSIVAAIVQRHGGRVELNTGPGRGAAFRVLLPAGVNGA